MDQVSTCIEKLSQFPLSYEMDEWENGISRFKKFIRLTPENRGLFFALLGKESDIDSYSTSPVYYALTGRKGLWLYQDGNTYASLCWHPNVDGQILVFPPKGENKPDILKKLLADIPAPPAGLRIARVKKDKKNSSVFTKLGGAFGRFVSASPIEEDVLDWLYPVRILSTERVAKMQGGHFLRTRKYIKLLQQKISVVPMSIEHYQLVVGFVHDWALHRAKDQKEFQDLVSPYIEALNLFKDEVFNIQGRVFIIDGRIQAVAMWELPNTSTHIANAWISLCGVRYHGLSEFVMKNTCEVLWKEGIPYLNCGGSETKGLDDYKNKFLPAYSLDLCSIKVEIEGTDAVLQSLLEIQGEKIAA